MKKLWNQNKIVFVLLIILLVCFIAIVGVTISFFYSSGTTKYGSRLEDIDKYPIVSEVKDKVKEHFESNETVTKYEMDSTHGRIIYIILSFTDEAKLENAKKLVESSLDLFPDDIKSYYDISFTLKSSNFTIIGAKNASSENFAWNNNREVKKDEE